MVTLVLAVGVVAAVLAMAGWFLLGFRLGGSHWQSRLLETQIETANAKRQLHDLTREAFMAMSEHVRRSSGDEFNRS